MVGEAKVDMVAFQVEILQHIHKFFIITADCPPLPAASAALVVAVVVLPSF